MYTVYILQSEPTKRYYIGSTNNLERRIKEHTANKTHSLIHKGPFKVIYMEQYPTRKEARTREFKIKSYKGGNGFKKLIHEKVQW